MDNFNFFPLNVAFVINSLSNLIFSPVTNIAILVDLIIVGLPSFFQICKLIIVRSDPESSWNFTLLFNIFMCTNFLALALSGSSNLVLFMLLIILSLDRQCELLCLTQLHIEHFLFRKVQYSYQYRAPHPEHGLGTNTFAFFDLLHKVGDFVSIH